MEKSESLINSKTKSNQEQVESQVEKVNGHKNIEINTHRTNLNPFFRYQVLVSVLTLIIITLTLLSSYLFYNSYLNKNPDYTQKRNQVTSLLKKNSINAIPSEKDLEEGELSGLVSAIQDPYTAYISKQEDSKFQDDLNQRYEGVGIKFDQINNKIVVQEVFDNSPAKKGGVQKNDILKKVEDIDVTKIGIDNIAQKIRGPQGTFVKLELESNNQTKIINLAREKITTNLISLEVVENIGIIKISSFGQNLDEKMFKVASQIQQNKNIKGIIIDLRGNGGGLLNESIEVISYFSKPDEIAVIEKTKNEQEILKTKFKEPNLKDYPTVILIDKFSASASEIMAGALRDNRQIKLIGQKSFGKGTVQQIFNLQTGDKLKITIAEWFTPKNKQINKLGLEPDIITKLEEDTQKRAINELKSMI
jgi:carboxyl-terminal processing protease